MALIPRALNAHLSAYEKDRDKKIPFVDARGEYKEVETHFADGLLSKAMLSRQDNVRDMLTAAAQDPDGGLITDYKTGKTDVANWTYSEIEKRREKPIDLLKDLPEYIKEKNAIAVDDQNEGVASQTWEDFVEFSNANTKNDAAKIDVDNKKLKGEWMRRHQMATFNPDTMGENEYTRIVAGEVVMKPELLLDIDGMEASINGLDKSDYEKKMLLHDYRKKMESVAGELTNEMSGADAKTKMLTTPEGVATTVGTLGLSYLMADVMSSPLRDDYMEAAGKPGFSFYEFVKENKERFAKDENGVMSEVSTKFRDAMMATGTGAMFLAGSGIRKAIGDNEATDLLSRPAEEFGWLAEETAAGYSDGVAFSVGDIDINRSDLTELTGQVGSFFAMGGIGGGFSSVVRNRGASLASKAAIKKAGLVAGSEGAEAIGKAAADDFIKTAATKLSDKAIKSKAAWEAKNFSGKALAQLKKVFTDPTAYAGALQASGMSAGRTFDQEMRATGDRDEAYRKANIEAWSDGLSALIATGVMNRFGMGAEAAFGKAAGSNTAGGIIQNLKSRMTGRATMKGVREMLKGMDDSPELKKKFLQGIRSEINKKAKESGLRGYGVLKETGSEAIEEMSDEGLSAVFKVLLDDTKTLNEEEWSNIASHWKDYVKAGILGGIGGFGGSGASSVSSGKILDDLGTSEALAKFREDVAPLKANVAKFTNDYSVALGNKQEAKGVAEYIAWDAGLPENAPMDDKQKLIEEKSAVLVNAALKDGMKPMREGFSTVTPPAAEDTPTEGDTPSVDDSATGYEEGSAGAILEGLNVKPPQGREWSDDVTLVPDDSQAQKLKKDGDGNRVTITPLNVSFGDPGSVDTAAAKVEITNAAGETTTTTISAKEAHETYGSKLKKNHFSDHENLSGSAALVAESEGSLKGNAQVSPTKVGFKPENLKPSEPSGNAAFDEKFPEGNISFDEENHAYVRDGEEIPSVSSVKAVELPFDDSRATDEQKAKWAEAAEDGSAFHDAISEAILNPSENTDPKIKSIIKLIEEKVGVIGSAVSEKIISVKGLAGTVDLMVELEDRTFALIDFKTMESSQKPHEVRGPYANFKAVGHQVQLLMYQKMLKSNEIEVSRMLIVPIGRKSKDVIGGKFIEIKDDGKSLNAAKTAVENITKRLEAKDPESFNPVSSVKAQEAAPKVALGTTQERLDRHQAISEEFEQKLSGLTPVERKEALARMESKGYMGLAGKGVNPKAIKEDFDKGLPYLRGESEAATSKQKKKVFEKNKVDIDEFYEFLKEHGGSEAYIAFVKAHELAHDTYKHTKDGMADKGVMSDETIAQEVEANQKALEDVGYFEWKKSKPESKEASTVAKPPVTQSKDESADQSNRDKEPSPDVTAKKPQGDRTGNEGEQEGSDELPSGDSKDDTGESSEASPTPDLTDNQKDIELYLGENGITFEEPSDLADYTEDRGVYYKEGEPVYVSEKALDIDIDTLEEILDRVENSLDSSTQTDAADMGSVAKGSTAESLDAETVETLNEESSYIVNRSDIDNPKEGENGQWVKEEGKDGRANKYILTPKKGTALNAVVGDIITISGDQELGQILILRENQDGKYIFDEVSTSELNAANMVDLIKSSDKYTRTRLAAVSEEFREHIKEIKAGTMDAATMRSLFNKVMKVVSPKNKFKVEERNLAPVDGDGGKFIFAEATKDRDGIIVVDFKRLADQFNKSYASNINSEAGMTLLSLDAARKMASVLDEEILHILTFKEFGKGEMVGFIKSILKEIKAGRKHPYLSVVNQVMNERFKTTDTKGFTQNDYYKLGAEVVRQLHQLGNSGFTTEMASEQSRYLQGAILADEKAGGSKFLRTIGEMVRRYANRIRNILYYKLQQGRITDSQREILMRLAKSYREAGIKGDVDYAYEEALKSSIEREERYEKAMNESIESVGRNHYFVLGQIRKLSKKFVNAPFSAFVQVDENMQMSLIPEIMDLIKAEKEIDIDQLNTVLAELNGVRKNHDGTVNVMNSSYQMAMTSAFLKHQKMVMLRDGLEVGFDEAGMGEGASTRVIGEDGKKRTYSGLVAKAMTGTAGEMDLWQAVIEDSIDSQEDPNDSFDQDAIRDAYESSHRKAIEAVEGKAEVAKTAFVNAARKEIEGLDFTKGVQGVAKLIRWTRAFGVSALGSRNTLSSDLAPFDGVNQIDILPSIEGLEGDALQEALNQHKQHVLLMLELWQVKSQSLDTEIQNTLVGGTKELLTSYLIEKQELSKERKKLNDSYNNTISVLNFRKLSKEAQAKEIARLEEVKAKYDNAAKLEDGEPNDESQTLFFFIKKLKETGKKRRDTKNPISKEQLARFAEFARSVEDYNDSFKHVINRAFGNFGVINREFGLNMKDLRLVDFNNQNIPITLSVDFDPVDPNVPIEQRRKDAFQAVLFEEDAASVRQGEKKFFFLANYKYAEDEAELTAEDIRWNAMLREYKDNVHSNAEYIGRDLRTRFEIGKNMGELMSYDAQTKYEETGGFNFPMNIGEQGDKSYEETSKAFPAFQRTKLNDLTSNLIELSKVNSKDGIKNYANGINEILNHIQEARDWFALIQNRYQTSEETADSSGTMDSIGGNETLGGRLRPVLGEVFDNDTALDALEEFLLGKNDEGGLIRDSRFLKYSDGKVSVSDFSVKKEIRSKLAFDLQSSDPIASFRYSVKSADQVLALARRSMDSFQDKRWINNAQKEITRRIRDAAFIPDNELMLGLNEVEFDARVRANLSWVLKYFGESRFYYFSKNYAHEMLSDFQALQRGEGYETTVAIDNRNPEYSDTKLDDQGGYSMPSTDRVIYTDRMRGMDDSRTLPSTAGESSNIVPGEDSSTTQDYNDDYATRNFNKPKVSRGIVVARWALIIGSNAYENYNINEGQDFYVRLMNMDRVYLGLADDTTGSEIGSQIGDNYVSKLLDTGLAGLFRAQGARRLGDTALQALKKSFIEQHDPKSNRYKYAGSEKLLHDLVEFKAKFERDLVEASRVTDNERIIKAMKTVAGSIRPQSNMVAREETDWRKEKLSSSVPDRTSKGKPNWTKLDQNFTDNETLGPNEGSAFWEDSETSFADSFPGLAQQLGSRFVAGTDNNPSVSSEEALAIAKFISNKGILSGEIKDQSGDKPSHESNFPMYDSDIGIPVEIYNPVLSALLSTLPGKTLIINPSAKDVTRNGLQNIGLRKFVGKDGNPNIIFVPQVEVFDRGISGSSAASATASSFVDMAEASPVASEALKQMAKKITDSINPVIFTDRLMKEYFPDQVSRGDRASKQELIDTDPSLNFISDIDPSISEMMEESGIFSNILEKQATPLEKSELAKLLVNHFMNLSRVARDLGITAQNASNSALFSPSDNATNALIVAEVLTNPKMKEFFDEAYIGDDFTIDQITEDDQKHLPEAQQVQLMNHLRQIGGTASDPNDYAFAEDQFSEDFLDGLSSDSNIDDLLNIADSVLDGNTTTTPSNDKFVEDLKSKAEALGVEYDDNSSMRDLYGEVQEALKTAVSVQDYKGLEDASGDNEGQSESDAVTDFEKALEAANADLGLSGDLIEGSRQLQAKIRELAEKNGEEFTKNDSALDNDYPSDFALFNFLSTILVDAKKKRGNLPIMFPEAGARDVSDEAQTRNINIENKNFSLPAFGNHTRKAIGVYAGEIRNLTEAKAAGSTAINVAYRYNRIRNINASLIHQTSTVQETISRAALEEIVRRLNAKDGKFPADSGESVTVGVPLSREFIDELAAVLPQGYLKSSIAESFNDFRTYKKTLALRKEQKQLIEDEIAKQKQALTVDDVKALSHSNGSVLSAIAKNIIPLFNRNKAALIDPKIDKGRISQMLSDKLKNAFSSKSDAGHSIKEIKRNLAGLKDLIAQKENLINPDTDKSFIEQYDDYNLDDLINEMKSELDVMLDAYDNYARKVNAEIDRAIYSGTALLGSPKSLGNNKLHLPLSGKVAGKSLNGDTITGIDIVILEESIANFSSQKNIKRLISRTMNDSINQEFVSDMLDSFKVGAMQKPGKNGAKFSRRNANEFFEGLDAALIGVEPENQEAAVINYLRSLDSGKADFGGFDSIVSEFVLSDDEALNIALSSENYTSTNTNKTAKLPRLEALLAKVDREIQANESAVESFQNGRMAADTQVGRTYSVNNNQELVEKLPSRLAEINRKAKIGRAKSTNIAIQINLEPRNPYKDTKVAIPEAREANHEYNRSNALFFALQKRGVMKALNEYAHNHIDDAYSLIKKSGDRFVDFDPLRMINEAISNVMLEEAVSGRQFDRVRTDIEKAEERGMTLRGLAMMTNPSDANAIQALVKNHGRNVAAKVRILNMPESFTERKETLGRYMEVGSEPLMLLPTDAGEQLMMFSPKTTNKRNVNSRVSGIILEAADFGSSVNSGVVSNAYFFRRVAEITDEDFDKAEDFNLTKGGKLTKGETADKFSLEFKNRMLASMKLVRNHRNSSGKEKEFYNDSYSVTNAQIKQYQFFIENIVLALEHPSIKGNKKLTGEIIEFLDKIDTGKPDTDFAKIDVEKTGFTRMGNMAGFSAESIFSKVFSAIETQAISERLALGLTISNSDTDQWMMKYAHHQDGRMRNRFRNSYAARQAALHLAGVIDKGIDGVSGREGWQTAKKDASDKIGQASKDLSGGKLSAADNKNQTIGYFIAMLNGLRDGHGQSLTSSLNSWRKATQLGFDQNRQFVRKQKNMTGNKFMSAMKLDSIYKYWNNDHIDLVRDNELTEEMHKLLKETGLFSAIIAGEGTEDEAASMLIDKTIAILKTKVDNNKQVEVQEYADVLNEVFRDIDAAMHIATAMSADTLGDVVKNTISSMPIRLSYASDPAGKKSGSEGRFMADPLDIVKLNDSSFFGGNVTSDRSSKMRGVYRPIAVNGITSPLSLLNDSLYRLNVQPTYSVLRKAVGKVQVVNNIPIVDEVESDMLQKLSESRPIPAEYSDRNKFSRLDKKHHSVFTSTQKTLAAIASEYEAVIQNDFQHGVVNTGGAEVMRVLGSFYIVRALASVHQLWDQTSGPSVGYSLGKIASGNAKSAALYWKTLGRMMTDNKFRKAAREYIRNNSPFVFYRAAEGQDVARDEMKGQRRFGRHKTKSFAGKFLRIVEGSGEFALDKTIASGERFLASTMFFVELHQQTGMDVDEILDPEKGKAITDEHKHNARVKVNDVMGQSDQAKKSFFFQTRDKNPSLNALWRTAVRFSNHTASMSSNTAVMARVLASRKPDNVSQADWDMNKADARENIVTTLVQNILFYPFKIKTLLPVLLYVAFKGMGDDDDKAVRNGQKLANKIMVPDDDSNALVRVAKKLIFGKKREAFQLDGNIDGAQASLLAEIMSKTGNELATSIPILGVAFGYSPIQGILEKSITQGGSEALSSLVTNTDKKDVYVRSYQADWLESAADVTAPTSVIYDYAEAGKLAYDYTKTNEFRRAPAMGSFNAAMYLLIAEGLPFLREYRSAEKGELKEEVKKLPRNRR